MLKGKVALVTGSTSGIGLGIATAFAQQGADIVLNGFGDAAEIEKVRAGLADKHGVKVIYDGADLSKGAAVRELVENTVRQMGRIDILVNNAGITRDTLAMRMKDDDWSAVIDTNLASVFRLSRAVLRNMMKARWGRIINVTSVVGSSGNPGQANYAAAKAGVAGMSRALARELGSRNITVNCVAPGFIDTDMTRALGENQTAALLQQIPLGRLGSPADIAHAVAFLSGPQAGYITGTTLHVNGGMYMQ